MKKNCMVMIIELFSSLIVIATALKSITYPFWDIQTNPKEKYLLLKMKRTKSWPEKNVQYA